MDYSYKATLYLQGNAFTPCNDCPFKNDDPYVSLNEKIERCFQGCPHDIMVWLLNKEQLEIYERLRPPERKQKDIEKAIKEGRIIQIEHTFRFKGGSELTVTPFFILKLNLSFTSFLRLKSRQRNDFLVE